MKRTDKMRLILFICIISVLLAVVILLVIYGKQSNFENKANDQNRSVESTSTVAESVSEVPVTPEPDGTSPETEETESDRPSKDYSVKSEERNKESSTPGTLPVQNPSTEPDEIVPIILPEPEPEITSIVFPYAIPGTSLVIRQISSYDGIYLEDGSDSEVSAVAAIVLENTGKEAVEFVRIQLQSDAAVYTFEASVLPAQSITVAQEKDQATYQDLIYRNCVADVASLDHVEMSADKILLVDNGNNTLSITNLTEEEIPCVRVFYKFFLSDNMIYVGGITYNAKVTDLKPGETKKITPGHYISGSSKVMMIRTYDTAE